MNRLLIILTLIYMTSISTACQRQSTVATLSEDQLTLSDKPVILKPKNPLSRTNNSLSIRIHIKEVWSPEYPWKNILLQDGTEVSIKVVLFSDKGTPYHPIIIGAGDGIDIRFNDSIPKNEKIVKIVLSSSYPLTTRSIKWVNWNPK